MDALNGGGFYDLNPKNMGATCTAAEHRREEARGMHSVSVEASVAYMGDRATAEDARRLTDPKTGKIMNPNDSADNESRPDHEQFKGAEVVGMGAIEKRGTFMKPMRMSANRAMGITGKPVKCRSIWENQREALA